MAKDWKKLIESNRSAKARSCRVISKDQIEFLKLARQGENPVPFYKMAELWERLGWGKMSEAVIRRIYRNKIIGEPYNKIS